MAHLKLKLPKTSVSSYTKISTLYNVCSVHRRMFSTSGGVQVFSTSGGYHEYIGGIP